MRALSIVAIKIDLRKKLRLREITKIEKMRLKICTTHSRTQKLII